MEKLSIGIDIGGTNLRFALVDGTGTILNRSRTTSSIEQGREAFCARLLGGVSEMTLAAADRGGMVTGIGIGVPGVVGRDGLIYASVNMRPLDGFNLAEFLERETKIPTWSGNDANVIALGEYIYGAGRGLESLIVITIGTGLGSGLILEGRLWSGVNGFAAEFGHVTVEPEGRVCPCGNRGCLEQYVSAGAIVRSALEASDRSQPASRPHDAAAVAALARSGDQAALKAFHQAGSMLGMALASLTNTLNLEAAVIGGGVSASKDLLFPAIQHELSTRCFPQISAGFRLIPAALGDDGGLLGGAALARAERR